jgi:hypothetical protein
MIPDNNEWGRIMVILVTFFAAILAAFVALAVSLTRLRKSYSALFGGAVGLVLFLMYLADMLKIARSPYHTRFEIWLSLGVSFLVLPVGLTFTAIAASAIASLIKR